MSIQAGRLRHRVLIEQYVLAVDSNGETVQDPNTGATSGAWQEVATVWAAIEPLSAKEFIASQAVQSEVVARIVIRYRPGMDPAMRLVHMLSGGARGAVYNPAGFLQDKDSGMEYITIPVSAGVNDGAGLSAGRR